MEKEKQTTVEVDKEQLEKMIKAIEDLTVRIEELNKTIKHKDAIIEKLQRMLSEKKSEKARHAEMMAKPCLRSSISNIRKKVLLLLVLSRTFSIPEKTLLETKTIWAMFERTKIVIEAAEEEKKCPWCGKEMEKIGEEKVRTRVIIERAEKSVSKRSIPKRTSVPLQTGWRRRAFQNEAPLPVIPHSFASAEAIAHVASERLSKRTLQPAGEGWKWLGLSISRRTMSNWIMAVSELYLEPVVLKMREHLLKEELCHCDETPIQVLAKKGEEHFQIVDVGLQLSAAVPESRSGSFNTLPEEEADIRKRSWKV